MEVVEEDVFFAELSRRISLLIMDDDDDLEAPVASFPSVSIPGFTEKTQPIVRLPYFYEQITCARSESKGTGVFIPQSSQRRRKNKHGRSFNTKSHVQPQNNFRGIVSSHLPNNYINYNSNPQYSFNNPRDC